MEKPIEGYKFLEHTGDIKFIARGKTKEEVFRNISKALSHVFSRGGAIEKRLIRRISLSESDLNALLYSFIDEIIYLFDAEEFVISDSKISLKENTLNAELYGDSVKNYSNLDQIKSATYHEMHFKKIPEGWEAQVVIDV